MSSTPKTTASTSKAAKNTEPTLQTAQYESLKKMIESLAASVGTLTAHTTKVDTQLTSLEERFNSFGTAVEEKFREVTTRLDNVEKQSLTSVEDAEEKDYGKGKKKNKCYHSSIKGKEKEKVEKKNNPTESRGNSIRPSRYFSSNNNPLPTTMLVREIPASTREVPKNFVVLKGSITNPSEKNKKKNISFCLDPCSSINIIPPKLAKELGIKISDNFTSIRVVGSEPTLRSITEDVYISLPLVVKGSHNKIAKMFTFTTRFRVAEHFDHTILLGANFLEKHKIYSSYDDQGNRTIKIVRSGKDRLSYPTEKESCMMIVADNKEIIANMFPNNKGLSELLAKPMNNKLIVSRGYQPSGNRTTRNLAMEISSKPKSFEQPYGNIPTNLYATNGSFQGENEDQPSGNHKGQNSATGNNLQPEKPGQPFGRGLAKNSATRIEGQPEKPGQPFGRGLARNPATRIEGQLEKPGQPFGRGSARNPAMSIEGQVYWKNSPFGNPSSKSLARSSFSRMRVKRLYYKQSSDPTENSFTSASRHPTTNPTEIKPNKIIKTINSKNYKGRYQHLVTKSSNTQDFIKFDKYKYYDPTLASYLIICLRPALCRCQPSGEMVLGGGSVKNPRYLYCG